MTEKLFELLARQALDQVRLFVFVPCSLLSSCPPFVPSPPGLSCPLRLPARENTARLRACVALPTHPRAASLGSDLRTGGSSDRSRRGEALEQLARNAGMSVCARARAAGGRLALCGVLRTPPQPSHLTPHAPHPTPGRCRWRTRRRLARSRWPCGASRRRPRRRASWPMRRNASRAWTRSSESGEACPACVGSRGAAGWGCRVVSGLCCAAGAIPGVCTRCRRADRLWARRAGIRSWRR